MQRNQRQSIEHIITSIFWFLKQIELDVLINLMRFKSTQWCVIIITGNYMHLYRPFSCHIKTKLRFLFLYFHHTSSSNCFLVVLFDFRKQFFYRGPPKRRSYFHFFIKIPFGIESTWFHRMSQKRRQQNVFEAVTCYLS